MKRIRLVLTCFILFVLAATVFPAAARADDSSTALVLTATGPVTPAMEQYINRGIREAETTSAALVIIQLDTPGGQIDIMSKIVQDIRASSVPVVVYVAPRGAMAASAGSIITLAGHAAAMAPETIIGAASPVGSQGEDIGTTMEAKTKQALTANVRTIASRRPPEAVKAAEEMVISAKAFSASEAKEIGLVDFIASDTSDLLKQLDGFTVYMGDQPVILHTADLIPQELPASFIEQLLATLINPNIVFILLTVGVQAILIELSSPGGWVSGFIGVVCMALAIYGLGILPVNWFGIFFLILAFILFIVDIKAPTHGALTAAGAGSMVVGALVLFNTSVTPSFFHISVPVVVATAALTSLIFFVIVGYALRAQKVPIRTGFESLTGRDGVVKRKLDPTGDVQANGELWTAESVDGQPIEENVRVRIVRVDGLRLIVEKKSADPRD
jgi:membrane-bound serine protease (ClpP class)